MLTLMLALIYPPICDTLCILDSEISHTICVELQNCSSLNETKTSYFQQVKVTICIETAAMGQF